MALNKVFASTQELHRDRPLSEITTPTTVPGSVQPGVPVIIGARPAVSITASGNATKTQTDGLGGGITSVTFQNGGAGNTVTPPSASFAFDGSYEFAVTGAATTTASEIEVYITTTGTLTLTVGTNVHYGWTDYPNGYRKVAGRAVVRVGK